MILDEIMKYKYITLREPVTEEFVFNILTNKYSVQNWYWFDSVSNHKLSKPTTGITSLELYRPINLYQQDGKEVYMKK